MQIEKVVLDGTHVRLEPLAREHLPGLATAIYDGELWQIPVTIVPHPDDLEGFFSDAERSFAEGRELSFATIDKHTGRVVGSTRYRAIERAHRRVEIGFTFLAGSFQRSHVNSEAKLLMLRHAFEVWKTNRVELLTDQLNEKSRRAIARIGARQEGVLRSHMVMRDGRIRDSVIFSMVASEWPDAQRALASKLGL
jgi:RimJ/RimL family protein N-acetyltransferase